MKNYIPCMNLTLFTKELRKRRLKLTPQRIAIFNEVINNKNHPTAEEIYHVVVKKFPSISLTTIYQGLTLLKEMGFLQELGYANRSSRYDPNTLPHINLICPKCEAIVDYGSDDIQKFIDQISKELEINPTGQRIDIYRICEKCKKSTD